MNDTEMMTMTAFAQRHSVTTRSVQTWIKNGLPVVKTRDRTKRGRPQNGIPKTDGDIWVAANSQRTNFTPDPMLPPAPVAPSNTKEENLMKPQKPQESFVEFHLRRAHEATNEAYDSWRAAAGNPNLSQARLKNYVSALGVALNLEQQRIESGAYEAQLRSEVEKDVEAWCRAVKALLESAPVTLAIRLNPTNPELAKSVLQTWIDDTLFPTLYSFAKEPNPKNNQPTETEIVK